MTIFRSNCSASSIAARRSSSDFAFEIPTLDPRFAGFTKTGNRSSFVTRAAMPFASAFHSRRSTTRYGPTGSVWAMNSVFITALSMPTADPSTPAPT